MIHDPAGGFVRYTLHFHPLSSFCWKALVGLYELDVPFAKQSVDLGDAAQRAALLQLSPIGRFPVLRDEARGLTVPESTILLEYVDAQSHARRLLPEDPDVARECRLRDRFFDLYVHMPMQRIVGDRLRPPDRRDPYGVEQAKTQIETSYGVADAWMRRGPWSLGDAFTLADCAAAPALRYANTVVPIGPAHGHLAAYLSRLEERASFARVLEEAAPYASLFPGG